MSTNPALIRVALEHGTKRVFASAIDWPGWCRSSKINDNALGTLAAYRERYNPVVTLAGMDSIPQGYASSVIEELAGSGATDFGVPEKVLALEADRLPVDELNRQIDLLRACWTHFDGVAAMTSVELKKGPRGGGRDRDAIIDHVIECDRTYARKIGVHSARMAIDDRPAIEQHRSDVFGALNDVGMSGDNNPRGWPVPYVIRRMAWHVLDHAWEMQDKTLGGERV